jgi:hypothetical protein
LICDRQFWTEQMRKICAEVLPHFDRSARAPRSFKVTPTAPMGGGTQLYEGAHLTGAIRAFVANQANAAIMGFLLL